MRSLPFGPNPAHDQSLARECFADLGGVVDIGHVIPFKVIQMLQGNCPRYAGALLRRQALGAFDESRQS